MSIRIALAAGLAGAVVAAALPAAAQQPSIQQQFDAGTAALAEARWADALRIYEALERALGDGRSARSLAIVRVRKGEALVGLTRDDEAREAIAAGLPVLPADDPSLAEDRLMAMLALAEIAERSLDFGEALKRFREAEAIATGPMRVRALAGAIRTATFFDAPRALADADRLLALVQDKKPVALARTLRGRVLLNLGRFDEARAAFKTASDLLGGLTLRADAADLGARSDMAIAALLAGREEEARKFMAYTGAGRLREDLAGGAEMDPPPCGDETGLAPSDVAVVEFSIRPDGTIGYVAPIYASREGASAIAFAEAVRGWSWRPETVANIPPLMRALTRVELRCSTGAERPGPTKLLETDFTAWLESRGLEPLSVDAASDARRVGPLRAELARREAASGPDSPAVLPVLSALGFNAVTPHKEAERFFDRAFAIARREGAPGTVLAMLGMGRAYEKWSDSRNPWKNKAEVLPLLDIPAIASDPRASAAVRLSEASSLSRLKSDSAARRLLEQVRDTQGLSPRDPLRVAALVRLAGYQAEAGDRAAAQASFEATGLSAGQCALLDLKPRIRRTGASSSDFPQEAARWGFEGWAKIEHDVAADGRTSNVRAVVAYPPFVFSKAGTRVLEDVRYQSSYRPDGSLGCGGLTRIVRFVLPG